MQFFTMLCSRKWEEINIAERVSSDKYSQSPVGVQRTNPTLLGNVENGDQFDGSRFCFLERIFFILLFLFAFCVEFFFTASCIGGYPPQLSFEIFKKCY